MAKLTAIMDDQDAEVGHQLMAIRLLIGDDLAAVIRDMEREHTEDDNRRQRIKTAVELVLGHHPEVGADVAERYVRECLDRMEPQNLTDLLKSRLGFLDSALDDDTLCEIWHELGLPGTPGPSEELSVDSCRFSEKTVNSQPATDNRQPATATPDPDREFLAQRAVEDERARREKLKHPAAVPSPPTPFRGPEVEAEPIAAPEPRPEPDTRPYIDFGGFAFYPRD